jgi:hypothetical protein
LDLPVAVVLESVKGALQMVTHRLTTAEADTSMDTAILTAVKPSAGIAPEDQVLAHAPHADWAPADLIRLQHYVPLVSDHAHLLLGLGRSLCRVSGARQLQPSGR